MQKRTHIKSIENLSEEFVFNNVNSIFLTMLNEVKLNLNLEPSYENIKIKIIKTHKSKDSKIKDIFSVGVNRYFQKFKEYGGYCDCEILMNAAPKLLGEERSW